MAAAGELQFEAGEGRKHAGVAVGAWRSAATSPAGPALRGGDWDQVTCATVTCTVICGSNANLNIAKKSEKKTCMFTAHIKITPKIFRSKFETYIEKEKREICHE